MPVALPPQVLDGLAAQLAARDGADSTAGALFSSNLDRLTERLAAAEASSAAAATAAAEVPGRDAWQRLQHDLQQLAARQAELDALPTVVAQLEARQERLGAAVAVLQNAASQVHATCRQPRSYV